MYMHVHEVSTCVVMNSCSQIYFWDEVSSVSATIADGVVFAGLGVAVGGSVVGCVDSPPSLIVPSLHQTDGGLCRGRWCYRM